MKYLLYSWAIIFLFTLNFSCKNAEEKTPEVLPEETIPLKEEVVSETENIIENDTVKTSETDTIVSDQYFYTTEGDKAAIQVRVGDVDNLGFGWDPGFDPFCGQNTSIHRYPWEVDSTDHEGTDRIMVVSAYKRARSDGYTSYTLRAHTDPVPIEMNYDPPAIEIKEVVLQMMLDDFQSPVFGSSFQFHINEKRLTYVESVINNLNQSGPTGKLVQVGMLPEDFELFTSGSINISIDDPINDAGDGFAIDFIQLLINPTSEYKCNGSIRGIVKDEQGNLLEGVLVSANGLVQTLTAADGTFVLNEVPVGMIVVSANKSGYQQTSKASELMREENKQVTLVLKEKEAENENYVSDEIKEKGYVNLYGILFDSGKDIPKAGSEPVLKELAGFLRNNAEIKIEIIGHTDSEGDAAYNEDLSRRRAKSVRSWLKKEGIDITYILADGKGEYSPVASNETDAGKALNRRVEVRVIE